MNEAQIAIMAMACYVIISLSLGVVFGIKHGSTLVVNELLTAENNRLQKKLLNWESRVNRGSNGRFVKKDMP